MSEPTPPQGPQGPREPQFPQQLPSNQFNQRRAQAQNWFQRLPTWGKIVAPIAAVVLLCMVCGTCASIGSAFSNSGSHTSTLADRATNTPKGPTATHGPTATPTPNYAHFGDGTFQVGKEIQPGTYRTREGASGCYYARLKGFSGSFDDIIANENADGPAVVTIAAGDAGFLSQNCGTWTQNLSQITKSTTSFAEGAYIVGTDIAPGTYKNDGSDGCYYARLKGFGGSFNDIIANGNPTGVAIVTIKATDKGFLSTRCGTWTKQ
jgi:hypothetical protein